MIAELATLDPDIEARLLMDSEDTSEDTSKETKAEILCETVRLKGATVPEEEKLAAAEERERASF